MASDRGYNLTPSENQQNGGGIRKVEKRVSEGEEEETMARGEKTERESAHAGID